MDNFMLKFKGIDFKSIAEGFADASKHPTAIFAVIGLVILAAIVLRLRKIKLTTTIITHIGVAIALGTILKMVKFFQMPNGGSATLGSMVPILLIALFYGPEIGMLTGLLFGILDFILGPYIMHPVQVLFDYPLAFTALGLAGYFRNKGKIQTILGIVIAIAARFFFHFVAGAVFYGSYAAPGQTAIAYSITYNASYLVPEGILCVLVLAFLPIKHIFSVMNKASVNS